MNNSIEIISNEEKTFILNVQEYSSVSIKSEFNNDLVLTLENGEKYISFEFDIKNFEDCNNYYEKIKEILSRKVEVKEND